MIYITGDTHAEYEGFLNRIYRYPVTAEDIVIVCGDFGFVWDHADERVALEKLKKEPFTIAFVDGNHEDFNYLADFPAEEWNGGRIHRISDNIVHLMRGQCFVIGGKRFFTMGGAYSIDRPMRIEGFSWFPQEIPDDADYQTAAETLGRCGYEVDYVLTHTVPQSVIHYLGIVPDHHDAELTGYLQWLYEHLKFTMWFAGHFHVNRLVRGNVQLLFDEVVTL